MAGKKCVPQKPKKHRSKSKEPMQHWKKKSPRVFKKPKYPNLYD